MIKPFETQQFTDDLTSRIEQEVVRIREAKEWRMEYMTFEMKLREYEDRGREEGRAEGLAEGRVEGRSEGLEERDREILKIVEEAERTGISKEEIIAKITELVGKK